MPVIKNDILDTEEIEFSFDNGILRKKDFQILNLTKKLEELKEEFPDYEQIFLTVKPLLNPTDRTGENFNPIFNRATLIFTGLKTNAG